MINKEFTEQPQDHIHHFGNELTESDTFDTKNDHDNFVSQEEEDDQEPIEEDYEDYHKAYLNATIDLQRKYNLRKKNAVVDPPKKVPKGQASTS